MWLLLVVGFVLASLPFVSERLFVGLPVLKKPKTARLRMVEFVLAYAVFVWVGRWFESSVSQVAVQAWAFYVSTALLFVVAAAPAFIWRYLWQKAF